MHKIKAFTLYLLNHYRQYLSLTFCILRQEDYACSISSLFRNRNALKEYEFVWNLDQDTGSIAGFVPGLSSPVFHILKYLESIANKFMALSAVYIHYHSNSTRIVLV